MKRIATKIIIGISIALMMAWNLNCFGQDTISRTTYNFIYKNTPLTGDGLRLIASQNPDLKLQSLIKRSKHTKTGYIISFMWIPTFLAGAGYTLNNLKLFSEETENNVNVNALFAISGGFAISNCFFSWHRKELKRQIMKRYNETI